MRVLGLVGVVLMAGMPAYGDERLPTAAIKEINAVIGDTSCEQMSQLFASEQVDVQEVAALSLALGTKIHAIEDGAIAKVMYKNTMAMINFCKENPAQPFGVALMVATQ